MDTQVNEIAPDIYRISTYIEPFDLSFNQFLVKGEEPLLFHCGMRGLFKNVHEAVGRVIPVETLRWITFGHLEADEAGAMNDWLEAAPRAEVAHGLMGCMVSINDLANRPPRPLQDGETIELGGRRMRYVSTAHVPHGWDAGVVFEETTETLLCGDLFTQNGKGPLLTEDDIVGPAMASESRYGATALTPTTGPMIRRLTELKPKTLGLMHGPGFNGDCARALDELASGYEERLRAALAAPGG